MATLNWADIVELTRDEAKQGLLDFLDGIGFTATSWQEDSVPMALVELVAEGWSRGSKIAVAIKESYFNATAVAEALTRYSNSHYDNQRSPAVAAQRRITLTCAAGEGPHSVGVGDLVASDDDGHTFRNIEGLEVTYPVVVRAGQPKTLLFQAEVPGSAANADDGTVTHLVTTMAGVTLADVIEREGVDEESDARLQLRNATKWALLSEWEMIADGVIQFALRGDPAIAVVGVDDRNPRGASTFDVYIAQRHTTASAQQVDALQVRLNGRFLRNIYPLARAAPEVALSVAGTIYHDQAFETNDVRAAVEQALKDYAATVPLGGFDFSPGPANVVPLNDIEKAIGTATFNGQAIRMTVQLTTPTANLPVPSFGKVVKGDLTGLSYVPITAPS